MPGYSVLHSEILHGDEMLVLRRDSVQDPNGELFERRVIERVEAVAVVPIRRDGAILLIRHYRHPIRRWLWDLPGGAVDEGEQPSEAARRELLEETGWHGDTLQEIGYFYTDPAFSDHKVTLFIATNLVGKREGLLTEPEIATAAWLTQQEVVELLRAGEVASSWTVIGLLRYLDEQGSSLSV